MASERLAVIFADVSESTSIYESLGDARALALVKHLFDLLTAEVTAGGGTIVKTLGDGMVCRFAEAERAFRTACHLQETALGAGAPGDGPKLALKIGLNWGPVVLERGDVFGDTVNVCARLAGLAGPHQVLTTQETIDALPQRMKSRSRELHPITVRGRVEAVKVWEVLWRTDPDVTEALTRSGLMNARKTNRDSVLKLLYGDDGAVVEPGGSVRVGRDKSNDLVVNSNKASRVHARIFARGDHFVIADQSSNGTYVSIDGSAREIVLLREETALGEGGSIGLGGTAAKPGDHVLRYRLESRKV